MKKWHFRTNVEKLSFVNSQLVAFVPILNILVAGLL